MSTEDDVMERLLFLPVIAGALLVSACSDDVKKIGSHDNDSTGTDYGIDDISGVWDISGSANERGEPVSGVLTIDRDTFILELGSVYVRYSFAEPERGLDFSTVGRDQPPAPELPGDWLPSRFETERVDLGAIPFDLGGRWEMPARDGAMNCVAGLEQDGSDGFCFEDDPMGYPGRFDGFFVERVDSASSVFGALGGVWNVVISDGTTGACTAVLKDTTLTAGCSATKDELQGRFTFTLNDGFGSGSSDEGIEVSAVRRR
jgi:hypothetical protein